MESVFLIRETQNKKRHPDTTSVTSTPLKFLPLLYLGLHKSCSFVSNFSCNIWVLSIITRLSFAYLNMTLIKEFWIVQLRAVRDDTYPTSKCWISVIVYSMKYYSLRIWINTTLRSCQWVLPKCFIQSGRIYLSVPCVPCVCV